jgi:hypothetical protein
MLKVKDTLRSTVNLTFDGRVIKEFHDPNATARFTNVVRVLRHLESRGCKLVPRLLAADSQTLRLVITSFGCVVEHLDTERMDPLFAELEDYPDKRNVIDRAADGRFCAIDFELATLLPGFEHSQRHASPTTGHPYRRATELVRAHGPRQSAAQQ